MQATDTFLCLESQYFHTHVWSTPLYGHLYVIYFSYDWMQILTVRCNLTEIANDFLNVISVREQRRVNKLLWLNVYTKQNVTETIFQGLTKIALLVFAFLFNKWWFIVSYDQIPWAKSLCLFTDIFYRNKMVCLSFIDYFSYQKRFWLRWTHKPFHFCNPLLL